MKPSRRSWHLDAILPGQNNADMIDICVAVDLSGSISDKQCKEFFAEIYGIMQLFSESFKIHVFTFDTAVYNPQIFTQDNIDEILTYEPQGGGGTNFMCVWDFMKENDIEPKKLVFFTDMYPCGEWGDPDYCDTLWIAHGTTTIEAPFGTTAYYVEA
jgi:predicted metal-dependent peptidase